MTSVLKVAEVSFEANSFLKELSIIQQEGNSFVQHLGELKNMWNELGVYRPHTTDATILLKRAEEDKIFQLLASLSSDYEDLRSHILMNSELPSFISVCATVQREEVRRKVMNNDTKMHTSEARAFSSNHKQTGEKGYKGKRPICSYCNDLGHLQETCWILHPELKPKRYSKDFKGNQKAGQSQTYKANTAASTSGSYGSFSTNPAALINEFAAYLKKKNGGVLDGDGMADQTALLGQFSGFLATNEGVSQEEMLRRSHQNLR